MKVRVHEFVCWHADKVQISPKTRPTAAVPTDILIHKKRVWYFNAPLECLEVLETVFWPAIKRETQTVTGPVGWASTDCL